MIALDLSQAELLGTVAAYFVAHIAVTLTGQAHFSKKQIAKLDRLEVKLQELQSTVTDHDRRLEHLESRIDFLYMTPLAKIAESKMLEEGK